MLAFNDFGRSEVLLLLERVGYSQSGQSKFKTLKKTTDGVKRLIQSFVDPVLEIEPAAVDTSCLVRRTERSWTSVNLFRRKSKMEIQHFGQKQVAVRRCISEATSERWRSEGIGPKFLKFNGRVLYRLCGIEASCLATSTSSALHMLHRLSVPLM